MTYNEIQNKISNKEYEPKIPFVRYRPYTEPTDSEVVAFLKQKENGVLTVQRAFVELDQNKQKEAEVSKLAYDNYNKARQEGQTAFYNDLMDLAGYKGHPIMPYLYDIAWDRGHSYGLGEVLCVFCDVVDKFLPLINKYEFIDKKHVDND